MLTKWASSTIELVKIQCIFLSQLFPYASKIYFQLYCSYFQAGGHWHEWYIYKNPASNGSSGSRLLDAVVCCLLAMCVTSKTSQPMTDFILDLCMF